jgi:hypothetical protein
MIIRDYESFGMVTEPTEPKRTYVKPNSFGTSEDQSSDTDTLLKPGKRLKIVEVRGQLEVVECE